jgi:RecB family exonuclease
MVQIEEMDIELDGRVMGNLLHAALGDTYHELASMGVLPLRSDRLAEAEGIAARTIDRLVDGESCPGTPAQRRTAAWKLRRMVNNIFDMEVRAGGALRFLEAETEVGHRDGVDIGGLRIRGRIDRIDASPSGAELFIIDYKTSSIPSGSKIGTAEGLQLPLYMAALAGERPGARVVGGAYLSADQKRPSGVIRAGSEDYLGAARSGCRSLDSTAFEELLRSAREVAGEAAAGMRAGAIAPKADRRCPSWCTFGPVCRSKTRGHRR